MIRPILFTVLAFSSSVAVCEADFYDARQLFLKGRYEEAFATYTKAKTSSTQVLGQADCLIARGKSHEAILRLLSFLNDANKPAPRIQAKLAHLYFAKGQYPEAKQFAEQVLRTSRHSTLALFITAELDRVAGRIEQASAVYQTISQLPADQLQPEEMYWIGQAMEQLARWNRDTQAFDRLVNDFYPQLREQEESFWPAHLACGKLFLEKFNEADAARELNAALAINPRAADVHVELGRLALTNFELDKAITSAERALKINPQRLSALLLTADITFANLQPWNAVEPLRQARQLNALHEPTLGRILATCLRRDGFDSARDADSQAAELIEKTTQRNSHCGQFFAAAGDAFNSLRHYPTASTYYKLALERLPQLVSARGKLGLVQMRLGEETEARRTLEESFQIDPFNVRVKNTLEVLDLLETYAVLETDHFVIRFDRGQDGLLAEYASRFLEREVYPDIVRTLGYEPKEKTLLEIFSRANGTSGHGWFSARMVGLPFISTVGACAGKMFALTSPSDGKLYNWARVLRHEFVHVVNLQQTNFLVPHWFTEAVAVRNEKGGYPPDWDRVLAKCVAEDNLFNLSNINHGFMRPGSSERWTLAYFQAYLYADFMVQLGGPQVLNLMLQSYADGRTTEEALLTVFNMSIVKFESEYRDFLTKRVQNAGLHSMQPSSVETLQAALDGSPTDAAILARLSEKLSEAGDFRRARSSAERALAKDKHQPLANLVMARLFFANGDDKQAWQYVQSGLASEDPDPKLLTFAAASALKALELNRATEYYRLGQEKFPNDFSWTQGLARALLAQNRNDELAVELAKIADRETDKTLIARKLTQLALQKQDFAAAELWANRVLHVNVLDPSAHAELADALGGQGRIKAAIREYEIALRLSPGEVGWRRRLDALRNE